MRKNIVYIVGAGPGDPGLLTLKGLECLENCEVVIYDRLVNPLLLRAAPGTAELIFVGKSPGSHSMEQEAINDLILEKVYDGKRVVRLKGGDPFIFGRGAEEAVVLTEHGIPFEIVPGITAGVGSSAYAGIPLTHRNCSSMVTFVSGTRSDEGGEEKIAWENLAKNGGTLCFYMGVSNLLQIADNLIRNGLNPDTPAAVIGWGTRPEQKTVVGTLSGIVQSTANIPPPAVVVVGEVVKLREQLNWFETKPLFGYTFMVTRERKQAEPLTKLIMDQGGMVIEQPTIAIEEPSDWGPLDGAIDKIEQYQWVVFTSVNGVESFLDRLWKKGKDVRVLANAKICSIGAETREALHSRGLRVDLEPKQFIGEAVIAALKGTRNLQGKKILFPRSSQARPLLKQELTAAGALVDDVEAYRTVGANFISDEVKQMLRDGNIHWITFASSSAVTRFCELVEPQILEVIRKKCKIASIGPITSQSLQYHRLEPTVEPEIYTISHMMDAIVTHIQGGK